MKYFDQSSKNRPSPHWTKLAAASLLAVAALAGCGGGSTGSPGPAGPPGVAGAPGAPGNNGLDGTNAIPVVRIASNTVASTDVAAANWKALAPTVAITGATIATTPVIKFTVKDSLGNPIVGLGNRSQSSSATMPALTNLAFTLAKLVPGTNNQPSKWVSYLVTAPANVTQASGTVAATAACNNVAAVPAVPASGATPAVPAVPAVNATWCGTYPTSDAQGTLVDNGDGSYQYTFKRDVTQAKATVASLPDTTDGLSKKADLGDLTYDATLTHRVGIQLGGAAPGTGSNLIDTTSATGFLPVASGAPVSVSMVNTGNAWYDFRPDGGSLTDKRNVVVLDSCSACHQGKVLAHGSRKDPNYCVTCHTDQIRYTFSQEATSTNNGLTLTGTTRPTTAVVDGRALGNFPNMIHKIHMGAELVKQGYFFNAAGEGLFNEVKYPQDQRNCTKCHSASGPNPTAQGDNWLNVPSILACGACHDGIKYSDGTGKTVAGATTGHGGWALTGPASADPTLCGTCHAPAGVAFVHTPVTPPNAANSLLLGGTNANTNAASIASNSANLPAGAIKVTYNIKSVSRNASKQPVMVFQMLQNGTATAFNTFVKAGAVATNAELAAQEIWTNFMGAPSVYFVFSVPQDGITAPADFNASASSYLRSLWNGSASGTSAGTLTGPDSSGYYTATLTGVTIPDTAVMLTGGLGYSYNVTSSLPLTQTNLISYPVVAATATSGLTASMPNKTGGLIVIAPDVQKVATGYTGRRAIVEDARCNNCHQELGVFTAEAFHAGQRNDGTTCSWCHNPNRTSSGWSADAASFVHGIHAASVRTDKFTWHAVSALDGFWSIGYPGVVNKCEACHLPGTYDFAASANAAAVPNRPYRTVATGIFPASGESITLNTKVNSGNNGCIAATSPSVGDALSAFSLSPYVTPSTAGAVTAYGIGFGANFSSATTYGCKPDGTFYSLLPGATIQADGNSLVNSPITTACVSCHDSKLAQDHMKREGGSIYAPRSTALAQGEGCMVCHATGKVADIKLVHSN